MASYGLKYWAEFKNTREHEYRLDIYQRGFSGTAKEVKTLCGCALEIQGAQGDVAAPIVKTQLRFSLVDAWDVADTASAKWGNWSEFYTPDATLYKVQLSSLSGNTATAIWTGYITPDSWQEDLGYRTAITITARDNIGHLKDFPFQATGSVTPDSNGLIEIRYIFSQAMSVIDFPMTFNVESYGSGQYSADVPCTEDGDYLKEAFLNAELFDGMNWYDVLERTLEAIGFAFRYVGGNQCVICCLRNLPKVGHYSSATPTQTLEFYGGSLEFEPAVKQIEEEIDYKMQKDVPLEILSGIQYGSATTYRCKVEGNTLPGGGTVSRPEHDAPADPVSDPGSTAWVSGYNLFNPASRTPDDYLKRDEGEDGWKQYPMIPSNHVSDNYIRSRFQFHTRTAAVKITVNFTPHPLSIRNSGSMNGKMMAPHNSLSQIKYQVRYLNDDQSVVRYWDGARWTTDVNSSVTRDYDAQNEYGTALEIELAECEDINSGTLFVCFFNIKYKMWYEAGDGVYARVQSILVGLMSTRAIDGDKVTTINNASYNVKVERRPLFGALSREVGFTRTTNYLAALFYYPYTGSAPEQFPYQVRFTDQAATVPLPVLIHQQILCYRHGAARVLNGRCAPLNKVAFNLGSLFTYKGTTYLLQGGTLDLFSGIMDGAVLHEFVDFNTLWTGTPTYSGDATYNTDTPGTGYSGGNAGGALPPVYTLPIASANDLGGVKVGSGLSIDENGVLSSSVGSEVSVSNLATTGNKVADLTIDGVTKTLKTGVRFSSYNNTKRTVQLVVGSTAYNLLEEDFAMISLLSAPVIEFQRGFTKLSGQQAINPILYARHPALGRITGAQYVLMVYSQRRGRNSHKGAREGCFARKGWGAAQGKTNHAGLTWTTGTKLLNDIREFILHNFIAISGEAKPSTMTYATLQAKSQYLKIGFSGLYNTAAADFKFRKNRRFGLAVRWENPAWSALGLAGTIDDTFTEYFENGETTRRWIYSDVAEFKVHVGYSYTSAGGTSQGWVIGFERV